MIARLRFNGKVLEIPDIIKAEGMKKFTGLMFKKPETNAMLFDNPGAIHSLFCPDFLAIWLDDDNKITDYQLVTSGKFKINPEKESSRLLEVPLNSKYSYVARFFLEEKL